MFQCIVTATGIEPESTLFFSTDRLTILCILTVTIQSTMQTLSICRYRMSTSIMTALCHVPMEDIVVEKGPSEDTR